MKRSAAFFALTLCIAAPVRADDMPTAEGAYVPEPEGLAEVPYAELYLQLDAGLLLREREDRAEPTFSHRAALGVSLGGALRIGAVFLTPMFAESLTVMLEPELGLPGAEVSSYSSSMSYLGGLEVAARAQWGLFVLHAGASAAAGAGPLPVQSDSMWVIEDVWVPAGLFGGFAGAGVALSRNTDLLVRVDLGVRVRERGTSDFLTSFSLGVDWH